MADRSDREVPRRITPPPHVLHAFCAQASPALVDDAREFAETQVKSIRVAGRPVSPCTPLELVNTALADTWEGSVTWDPTACSLRRRAARACEIRAGGPRV